MDKCPTCVFPSHETRASQTWIPFHGLMPDSRLKRSEVSQNAQYSSTQGAPVKPERSKNSSAIGQAKSDDKKRGTVAQPQSGVVVIKLEYNSPNSTINLGNEARCCLERSSDDLVDKMYTCCAPACWKDWQPLEWTASRQDTRLRGLAAVRKLA
ncbi:hypothetical protein IAQ61_010050 [Plenodomus lingam]|uniref:uncharacterized protein n=1 Tax=Leptosphaeria maculans TaxID=5022 RepID=UPI003317F23A|nr:hypothetical protein IAQ61_010050 [Plenodomus lingam]